MDWIKRLGSRYIQFPQHKLLSAITILAGFGVIPASLKIETAAVWADSQGTSEPTEHHSTPPSEPTEFIAAWIADLQQSNQRWIQVDLSDQRLTAWEGNTPMYSARVSTGREGDWTPPGVYAVETKYRTTSMQGEGYNIPDVPYVMYFFGSYAIHGVYWHNDFGAPASRGCVGLEPAQAEWLFDWASEGTRVVVQQ